MNCETIDFTTLRCCQPAELGLTHQFCIIYSLDAGHIPKKQGQVISRVRTSSLRLFKSREWMLGGGGGIGSCPQYSSSRSSTASVHIQGGSIGDSETRLHGTDGGGELGVLCPCICGGRSSLEEAAPRASCL